MTPAPRAAADVTRWGRTILHRYAALHDTAGLRDGLLPAELVAWLRGEGPPPERVARARALDVELAELRRSTQHWNDTEEDRRWLHLLTLAGPADSDLARDLLVLLATCELSPRAAATVRQLSGWGDSNGVERSFAQGLLDPLEEHAADVAALLRTDHPLAQAGLVQGLAMTTDLRAQFLTLPTTVLTWLASGTAAACRGQAHLRWLGAMEADPWHATPVVSSEIERLATALHTHRALHLQVSTADDGDLLASGAARQMGKAMLHLDVAAAGRRPGDSTGVDLDGVTERVRTAALLARLADAVLVVVGLDDSEAMRGLDVGHLGQLLQHHWTPLVMVDVASGDTPVLGMAAMLARACHANAHQVQFCERPQRLALWQAAVTMADVTVDGAELERLSTFPLSIGQIAAIARERGAALTDLAGTSEACRTRIGHRVGDVAQRVTQTATWDQVVLPPPVTAVAREMMAFAQHGETVLGRWGFAARYHYGLGLTALFSGPPGTGKTMLAGLMARELGLDLYRIDLSRVMSKYIGETEQRLGRLFEEGQRGGVALLFDEADSLFARRTEVRSSVDRYANLEVNFLLQKLEEYPGVVILTTNFADSIDEAFKRRIRFHAQFPLPGETEREQLWAAMLPPGAPVEDDLPFDLLAKAYEFSGGEIKNAVLRAAFYAAVEASPISLALLDRAAQAECQERGRLVLRTAMSLQW